ncbi:hypothetical protein [Saccharomonospora saliphila]|uniref:hypothetical protein n=1 Tax=Saccharomonospora saliphila TaxID=369829 RepID=UPI00037CF85A|nr:hypothetical protein [Saccharomonospora saliphila]
MRRCLPRALALPVVATVLVLSAAPAAAQTVPTTPEPEPSDENQPPITSPTGPVPTGRAMAEAGTALGVLRLGPEAVPADSILPGAHEELPDQSALEGGFGLAKATADSESYLNYERAVAEAAPFGLSVAGHAPTVPGAAVQTALPDNEEPVTTGLAAPENPLVRVSGLEGRAHARWSPTLGPCVGTISDASTSAASLSLLDALPTMPDTPTPPATNGESPPTDRESPPTGGVLPPTDDELPGADALPDLGPDREPNGDDTTGEQSTADESSGTDTSDAPDGDATARDTEADRVREAFAELPGPLARLGGLLGGGGDHADGTGTLLSVPNTLSARSVVRLIDQPGTERKAVEAISTMRAAEVNLLKGTPFGLTVKVVSQPTLRVVSTGVADTSTVDYTAPVLAVRRGGETLFELDAANPTADIPVGIPLPGIEDVPGLGEISNAPVVGDVAELAGGGLATLPERASDFVLDVGVLRLSIAELTDEATTVTDPFAGHHVSAAARMLDLRVLPTDRLRKVLPDEAAERLPSSLAQISLGEQTATAYAPEGGVECGTTAPPADVPPEGGPQPAGPPNLAYTSGAYSAVPLFWTGTAMLLTGVVLVAALPNRGPRTRPAHSAGRPSPHPRHD